MTARSPSARSIRSGLDGYAEMTRVERVSTVSPLAFADLTPTVDEIPGY